MGEQRLIMLRAARERLGVSKATMARLVREGRFTVYENPLDRRQKLIDEAELAALLRPRPAATGGPDNGAANSGRSDESSRASRARARAQARRDGDAEYTP